MKIRSAVAFLFWGLACAMIPRTSAACPIDGPTTAEADQSFTLCAEQSGTYTFEWHGSGVPAGSSRCITIPGRRAGSYTYQLIVRRGGTEVDRCSHTVTVGSGGFGALTCDITGPASIPAGTTATLCGPQSSRHSYRWTGPGGFTSSSRCITASVSGTYELSIVNTLTGYTRECSQVLTVGSGGSSRCLIDGPDVVTPGANVQLCAPVSSDAIYRWEGPNNFRSSSRCLVTAVPGMYYLTVRSRTTGEEEQCSRELESAETGTAGCTISGPNSVPAGGTAEVCAQLYSNSSYSWTGPGSFRAAQQCIRVSVPGVYRVSIRNRSTGGLRECSFTLDAGDDVDNADDLASDNCPRTLAFWQQQCRRAANTRNFNPNDFTLADLRAIARRIDESSTHFNWSDDANGLCSALNPASPLTNRKQVIRQYAALLANVAAGELEIATRNGQTVSLDPGTPGTFGSANTIGELIALTERMLVRGRGNFSALSRNLNAVNSGRGIGPVCQ